MEKCHTDSQGAAALAGLAEAESTVGRLLQLINESDLLTAVTFQIKNG